MEMQKTNLDHKTKVGILVRQAAAWDREKFVLLQKIILSKNVGNNSYLRANLLVLYVFYAASELDKLK